MNRIPCIEGCGRYVAKNPSSSFSYSPRCRKCARKRRHIAAKLDYKRRRKPHTPISRMREGL